MSVTLLKIAKANLVFSSSTTNTHTRAYPPPFPALHHVLLSAASSKDPNRSRGDVELRRCRDPSGADVYVVKINKDSSMAPTSSPRKNLPRPPPMVDGQHTVRKRGNNKDGPSVSTLS